MDIRTQSEPTVGDAPRRLLAPDIARGLMLLLITMAYAGVYTGAGFGVVASDESSLDQTASLLATVLLDNRAFPLFAILFGYGIAWSVSRQSAREVSPRSQRRTLRRRALLLLLFGAVHAILVFPGEILTSYGIALLITGWLLFRSPRTQKKALTLLGLAYLFTVPLIMIGASLTEDGFQQGIPGYTTSQNWIERLTGPLVAPLYVAIAYPLLFLVVLGYLAGRARLFENTVARRPLLRRVAWGGIAVSVLGALPAGLIILGALQPDPIITGLLFALQVLTGVAGGAGYAACFALGADKLASIAPRPTRAVAAMGKRSLTFYILNSALAAVILHPDLLGVGTMVGHFGALVVAAAAWVLSLSLAVWLEHTGRTGPLEQLMRRGVHGPRRAP